MIRHSVQFCAVAVLLTLLTCSQNTKEMPQRTAIRQEHVSDLTNLEKALYNLSKDPVLRQGVLSFSLRDTQTGKLLLDYEGDKTRQVASCMKAVTTASALEILGANYRFKTLLEYGGTLSGSRLNGDLFIKGGGDPVLGSLKVPYQNLQAVLNTWVTKIKASGIREISGRVVADEDAFFGDVTPSGWIWGDMGNYFGAPAGAINVLDNTYRLYFQPGKVRWRAKVVKTVPFIPRLQFINEVTTAPAGTGDQASISGAPYDDVRYVSGTIPQGGLFSIKGSIPDPAAYLAYRLTNALQKAGIKVQQKSTTTRLLKLQKKPFATQRKLIYTHTSPTLQTIVRHINLYSINLYAEAVLKAVGLFKAKEASPAKGTETIVNFWKNRGINTQGFYMADGSGLALNNGITANQLSHILFTTTKMKHFQAFYNSLPVAGVSGTMKGIGQGTRAYNNLRAKTGGMTRVIAFTGYFKTAAGKLRSFALVANQYNSKYHIIKQKLVIILKQMVNSE